MLVNENTNVINLLNNNLLMVDYFLKLGMTKIDEIDLDAAILSDSIYNVFFVKDTTLLYQMADYYVKADLDYCLSFILQHFTDVEIKQTISMFKFHNDLFYEKAIQKNFYQIIVSPTIISLRSDVINIDIERNKYIIFKRSSFFNKIYELDTVYFDDLYTIITDQLKSSISLYAEDDVKLIDNKIIKKILNESVDEFYKRINNRTFFNLVSDNEFYKNIINSNLSYELQNMMNFDDNNFNYFINKKDLLFLQQPNEDPAVELQNIKNDVSIYSHINKVNVINKLLKPLFNSSNLSYVLSIISVLNLFEKMNNPYSNNYTLRIHKYSTTNNSKADVMQYSYITVISFGSFDIMIGRITSVIYMKKNYLVKDLKEVYKKVIDLTIENLSSTLNIDPEKLTFKHIKLQQMVNS